MVAPGLTFPSRSAVSIMLRQIRSLTEPPGLKDSIFAHTSASFLPGSVLSFTTGVEPIRSRTDRAPLKLITSVLVFLNRGEVRIDVNHMLYSCPTKVNEMISPFDV